MNREFVKLADFIRSLVKTSPKRSSIHFSQAVSAMPPSTAIAAPVLGGPESVRVVLNSSSTLFSTLSSH